MKIEVEIEYRDKGEGNDYQYIVIKKDGERIYGNSAHEVVECPEDGIFNRDLLSCYDLLSAFKLGYELAGGKEEDIELIEEEVD